jgi:hypothetical protein
LQDRGVSARCRARRTSPGAGLHQMRMRGTFATRFESDLGERPCMRSSPRSRSVGGRPPMVDEPLEEAGADGLRAPGERLERIRRRDAAAAAQRLGQRERPGGGRPLTVSQDCRPIGEWCQPLTPVERETLTASQGPWRSASRGGSGAGAAPEIVTASQDRRRIRGRNGSGAGAAPEIVTASQDRRRIRGRNGGGASAGPEIVTASQGLWR